MQPDVLVLDEPSSNLDPHARRQLIGILQGLDVTKIVVTHDLPYACAVCSRAVVLAEGRVVADGPIAEIVRDEALLAANGLELPLGFDAETLLRETASI
jgi:cobalt/nickel transport system ATP-binding protein